MAQRPWNPVLEQIRSLVTARSNAQACDAELLTQFLARRDEAAFEGLLRRHGPMVLRVARRVLGCDADAEDVFQATFLLLARRASAIRKRASVAGWLHGVAHRLALSARAERNRRQARERRAVEARPVEAPATSWDELETTLHEALAGLPGKYRTPLVCCYLEGRTQEEVARELGVPLGTLRSWVARGRELLRKRLLRRGISLSVEGASTALLASACADAGTVTVSLRITTLQAARVFAGGGKVMTLVSPQVSRLVRKAMIGMLVAKLKGGAACLLILAFLAVGTVWAAHRGSVAEPPQRPEAGAEGVRGTSEAPQDRVRTDAQGDPLPPGALARLGTIRFRQEGWLGPFAISPDDRMLAAGARMATAFWELPTGRPIRWLTPGQGAHVLAFAPDGKSVAVSSEDCVVHLLDVASGKESRRFVGHLADGDRFSGRGVWGAGFTSDGRTLVTWGSDKTVRLWDASSGKELRQLGGKDWIVEGLSPDGKLLAVVKDGSKETLRLWDLDTDKEVRQLTLPAYVGGVTFSPDGKTIAVAFDGDEKPGRIRIWNPESGKDLGTLAGHERWVFALAFSSDGKMLATGGYDKTIRLWDLRSGNQLHKPLRLPTPVYQLAFSKDGKTLLSRGAEHHVRMWDVAAWREVVTASGSGQSVRSIAFSPDGRVLASSCDDKIRLWRTADGNSLRALEGHTTYLELALSAFSADGKRLVSGGQDHTLRVWDPTTGKEQHCLRFEAGSEVRVALSADGKVLAAWSFHTSNEIHLWHADTGEKWRTLEVPPEQPGVKATISSLCFSGDSKTLFASSGTHVAILRWDVATGRTLPPIGKHDGGLNGMALAPDGRSIAAVTMGGSLYLWETATGENRLLSKDAGYATTVAFSPDGRMLALANAGNHYQSRGKEQIPEGADSRETIRLVRVTDGKVIRRLTGHLGGVNCLSFSPDGRTLASGGRDTTVLVWDVKETGTPAAKDGQPLQSERLDELWAGLRGAAAEAHGSMNALLSAPAQTVPFLGEHLKPVAALDEERFTRLMKQLDSDRFKEREEAARELQKLGDSAEPSLRRTLKGNLSVETRRRLEALLEELGGSERLRTLRAIEVLERIADRQARDLLRRLSKGASDAWLTEEARATLRRLEH